MGPFGEVRALLFDVFGTVVDWRGSLIGELGQKLETAGIELEVEGFVDQWRSAYGPSMDSILQSDGPYKNLDTLHRDSLVEILSARSVTMSADLLDDFVMAWHRLDPWPDSVPGLVRLRKRFTLATMSNGNVALLTNMAKRAGLPWDVILTPELLQSYKKNLDSYRYVISLLGLQPEQTMMVAAHPGELAAVSTIGMRTAYVARPMEHGTFDPASLSIDVDVDLSCSDMEDLASQLGV